MYIKKIISFLFGSFVFLGYSQKTNFNLLIGTYTKKCDSKGIYVYEFNAKNANFKFKNSIENVVNPSYLTVSEDKKKVYSVNENGAESEVSAFNFEKKTGKISFLNKQKAKGADPCYVINDKKNVLIANYSGGNLVAFKKNVDGSLAEAQQIVQQYGKGVKKQQEASHAHIIYFSPDKKYVLTTNLGNDKIYTFKYNPNAIKVLEIKDSLQLEPGSGPRHLVFSKNNKFVYVVNELNATVTAFDYVAGKLKKVQETSLLVNNFKGNSGAADIHISPDGKFLYATNRGDANTISIFEIQKNGQLILKGQQSTLGKGPRNFAIDPTGNYLLIGHQYTNDIVIFKINKTNGSLDFTGNKIELCSPVCLVFE